MDGFEASRGVATIRERLGHPVIDSDGHLVEFRPVAMEYIARAGGADMARTVRRGAAFDVPLARLVRPEPGRTHGPVDAPSAVLGRAVAQSRPRPGDGVVPGLLYRRLDQLGIDFTVLFPTIGINPQGYADEDDAARLLSRPQRLLRRPLDGSPRSDDAGRDHPDVHARGGNRGARVRGHRTRLQGGDAAELREAAARSLVDQRRRRPVSRGGPTRSASTASTTTTRCGRSAASSASCRASTVPAKGRRSTTRSPTPSTTTSGTSPARRPRSASRCSSAA